MVINKDIRATLMRHLDGFMKVTRFIEGLIFLILIAGFVWALILLSVHTNPAAQAVISGVLFFQLLVFTAVIALFIYQEFSFFRLRIVLSTSKSSKEIYAGIDDISSFKLHEEIIKLALRLKPEAS